MSLNRLFPAISVFVLLLFNSVHSAADNKKFHFKIIPLWGENRLQLNHSLHLSNNKTVIIENFRFYISGVCFIMNEKEVFCECDSYRLVDFSGESENTFEVIVPEHIAFNKVKFNIGIDSITNYSGVRSGNLDPITGMYWSWQSGYINIKLEGKLIEPEKEPDRFEYHLGGFMSPFNSLQTVTAALSQNNSCTVFIDLKKFATETGFETLKIMSPSVQAMRYSRLLSNSVSVK